MDEKVYQGGVRLCVSFSDAPKKFITFDEVVAQRRAEARRSLVLQVNSDSSFNELYGYCSRYASINGIHHYKNNGGEVRRHLSLQCHDNITRFELKLEITKFNIPIYYMELYCNHTVLS